MPLRAVAYSRFWRAVAALATAASGGSLLVVAFALAFLDTPLENPLRILRTFVAASVAPGLAAWLLARAFAATVEVREGVVAIARRHERIEVPCEAIAAIEPWRLPLPAPGFAVRLRSGRRVGCGVVLDDPSALSALVDAIVAGGGPAELRDATASAAAVYAASRPPAARWWMPLVKYVLFALVPTIPLYRLHQWVTYGGTFGEAYIYGWRAYFVGFAAYWSTFAIWLVLWAAVLRAVAETIVAVTARRAPGRVAAARRTVERVRAVAYVAGVPLFLLRVAILAS